MGDDTIDAIFTSDLDFFTLEPDLILMQQIFIYNHDFK